MTQKEKESSRFGFAMMLQRVTQRECREKEKGGMEQREALRVAWKEEDGVESESK